MRLFLLASFKYDLGFSLFFYVIRSCCCLVEGWKIAYDWRKGFVWWVGSLDKCSSQGGHIQNIVKIKVEKNILKNVDNNFQIFNDNKIN